MASYREIVTKTVIGKGKKTFSNHYNLTPEQTPTTILGCWVINHNFKGYKNGDKIEVDGSCDVNIWYAYDNDTKTIVTKKTITYRELLSVARKRESDINGEEEIIVRSLKQPTCTKVDIVNGTISYDIEKELGIEIVGDAKVRIAVDEEEDEWDEIIDEKEAEKSLKKMQSGKFDLDDFLLQMKQIKKLGPLENLLKLLPGASKMGLNNVNINPKDLAHIEAIILSMTPYERKHPEILKASRKERIAKGSGRNVMEVNRLLTQFEQSKKMMKMISNGNMKLPF